MPPDLKEKVYELHAGLELEGSDLSAREIFRWQMFDEAPKRDVVVTTYILTFSVILNCPVFIYAIERIERYVDDNRKS